MTQNQAGGSIISLRNLSLLVVVLAIIVSGYLSYLKLSDTNAVCVEGGSFDCGTVLNSVYSEISGVPIAVLGLITDLIVLSFLLLERRLAVLRNYGVTLIFGVMLFAFLYSVYLVYLQAMVIGAYCPWCLSHEAMMTILFLLAFSRLWQSLNTEPA